MAQERPPSTGQRPTKRWVVYVKARRRTKWNGKYGAECMHEPDGFYDIQPGYLKNGSGNAITPDLQEAQMFGWSKRAQENLGHYRKDPECYDVLPASIQVGP